MDSLLVTLSQQPDPIGYLITYLEDHRIAPEHRLFHSQTITGLVLHGCITTAILLATYLRHRRQQLWFIRQQQGKSRLNATVVTMLCVATYSSCAFVYICLMIHQQALGRYIPGTGAFQLSCFAILSCCVSIIAFTYHQSLPVGFEGSTLRRLCRKDSAAVDRRLFTVQALSLWLVASVLGIIVSPLIYDYWRRRADSTVRTLIEYLNQPQVRTQGTAALLGASKTAAVLSSQFNEAAQAVRYQMLVYIGHAALYLLIITPVAYKLISLLSEQINTLHRNAEDFFRLGSRLDSMQPRGAPSGWSRHKRDESVASSTKKLLKGVQRYEAENPRTNQNGKVFAPHHHYQTTLPDVDVAVAQAAAAAVDVDAGDTNPVPNTPNPVRKFAAVIPLPQEAQYPLQRVRKLKRIRTELLAFSCMTIGGLVNFLVWCCFMYKQSPGWSSSELSTYVYTVWLWCYLLPAIPATVVYVLLTVTLANQSTTTPSTPSDHHSRGVELIQPAEPPSIAGRKFHAHNDISPPSMLLHNKRTQPTYPRAASLASLALQGDGTAWKDGHRTEVLNSLHAVAPRHAENGLPDGPYMHQDSGSRTSTLLPGIRRHTRVLPGEAPLGPASQTMSWIELDED